MGMIDPTEYGLDDAQEPFAVKPGEYKLRIVDVRKGTDKNGLEYLMPSLEVSNELYSKDFTHFLHIPDKEEMSEKQLNRVRFAYGEFCRCFGINLSRPFDPEDDWPGHEGWAMLKIRESEEYGEQNYISKLVAPK